MHTCTKREAPECVCEVHFYGLLHCLGMVEREVITVCSLLLHIQRIFFFFSVFLPMNTSYSISNKQHSKGGFIGNFREDLIVLLKLKNGVFMLKDS